MNILSLPLGADTGGTSNAMMHAFADQPGWSYRAIISTLNYLDYPRDLEWTRRQVRHYWRWADVIHRHHQLELPRKVKAWHLPDRPMVVTYHGTGFREDPQSYIDEMHRYGALGLVSTLDLWLLAPTQVEWLPCPIDLEAMQRRRHDPTDTVIRIAHAPTNREIKSTAEVIEAVERLKAEGLPVELDLIEGVNWDTCLERKSKADIYVDQVILGYGNNAIECWGMGIPVICGAQPATIAEMERRFGELPFYRATEGSIYDAIKALALSPDLRAEYAAKGLAHVRKYHDERVVVEQLKDIYLRAAGRKAEAA